jgi:predicted RNase H-like HicB family nuclease
MQYRIKIKQNHEGFAIWCEDLPGCASQGETELEAIENIKIAIEEYLEVQEELRKDEKLIFLEI